jgi:hypothetical protein
LRAERIPFSRVVGRKAILYDADCLDQWDENLAGSFKAAPGSALANRRGGVACVLGSDHFPLIIRLGISTVP